MKASSIRTNNVAVPKKLGESPGWLARFQVLVGIVVSATTIFISWQTYQLTLRTQETTAKLKEIEQQLAESKFGFERMRDIYDRTEKYLSATTQDTSRGRVLVVLISSLPDTALRSELLAVVTQQATLNTIAAKAASVKIGPFTFGGSASQAVPSPSFSGNLAIAVNEEKYTATTIGDFQFVDRTGKVWKVPKGTVTTVSAIPRMAWSLVGPPLTSDYTVPTVLLEYFVSQRMQSPEQVYQMFHEALLATGMSEAKAKTLHSSIVSFGPRWNVQP